MPFLSNVLTLIIIFHSLSAHSNPNLPHSQSLGVTKVYAATEATQVAQLIYPTPKPSKSPIPSSKPQPAVAKSVTISPSTQLLNALNSYRAKKGQSQLSLDSRLDQFAKSRSNLFQQTGQMDQHAGFMAVLNTEGFNKLGFFALGENSSAGFTGSMTDLIEKFYASDPPHDNNQLNPSWTHVGIGVSGNFTDLVFGGKKI